jgi:hypothetical protein
MFNQVPQQNKDKDYISIDHSYSVVHRLVWLKTGIGEVKYATSAMVVA